MKSNSSHGIGDNLYVKWDLHSTCADAETFVRGGGGSNFDGFFS